MINTPIKCAVVGLKQGLENVYVTLNHPDYDLCAVCDVNREPYNWITGEILIEQSKDDYASHSHIVDLVKLIRSNPRTRQIPFYSDFNVLLQREDIEAVFLVVPRPLHESYTRQAMTAGKYVLCSKPMCDSLQAAHRLLELSDKYPGHYMCGFQFPYSDFGCAVRSIVATGEVGEVRLMRFDYHRGPFRPIYRAKQASGGTLKEEGCHWLDLFYHFSGSKRWSRITGLAGLDVNSHIQDIEDNGVVVIEYQGGIRASHGFTYFSQFGKGVHRFELVGDSGRLMWCDKDMLVETKEGLRSVPIHRGSRLPSLNHPGYYEMHDEFARMIRDGVQPLTDAQAAYENMLCTYAAQEAIDTGNTIERAAYVSSSNITAV